MRKDNNILVGYAAVLVYSCLSGVSFVWTKRLLEHGFPVFTIVLIRLIIGAIFLLLTLRLFNKLEPLKRKDIKDFILLAIGEPFIYFIGEDFGLKYVDASFASVIIAMIPVLIAFVIPKIYGGKVKRSLVIGACISFIGIIAMSFNKSGLMFDVRGLLFLLLALASAIWYNVFLKKLLQSYGAFTITAYMNVIGALIYLPLFFISDFPIIDTLNFNLQNISDLLCLGVLCSAGSYGLYSFSASKLGVEKVSVFNNASPIVTIFASILLGMEPLTARKLLGVLIVVLGVIVSQGNLFKNKNA